jgi:crotonobetainyl-CoA:carnitine CoA-transferase CaiB-like acyl-CoA transferase
LHAINPKLVYCSITGFRQTGPYKDRAGYDYAIQGMGGLMSVTGEREGQPGAGPQKVGIPIVDIMTGMYAAVSVLAALARRHETGQGETIDIAMLDVQVATLANQAMNHLVSGKTPVRNGNAHPNIQPQDVYPCKEGEVILVVGNDGQFARLCKVLGHAEWAQDTRFATNAQRVRHIGELSALLRQAFMAWSRKDLIAALDQAGVPCGPINSVAEVFEDPQVQHRGMFMELPHPCGVKVPQVASPMRFSEAPVSYRSAPPTLGQHSDDILHAMGYEPERIVRLREAGVI